MYFFFKKRQIAEFHCLQSTIFSVDCIIQWRVECLEADMLNLFVWEHSVKWSDVGLCSYYMYSFVCSGT